MDVFITRMNDGRTAGIQIGALPCETSDAPPQCEEPLLPKETDSQSQAAPDIDGNQGPGSRVRVRGVAEWLSWGGTS